MSRLPSQRRGDTILASGAVDDRIAEAGASVRKIPQSIEQLVEWQGRRWAQSRARLMEHREPCVVISRLRYSGAHDVGERVAAELGYGFFGSEIVDQIAKDEGVQRELVAGLDERVQNAIERYLVDGFRHRPLSEADFTRAATKVISTLARRGKAVILGRGAVAIVEPLHALRVFVVAPLEWRRARLAEVQRIAAAEVANRLSSEDAQRAAFLRRNFHFEQDDAVNYDLVVNTGSLGLDGAAATIIETFRQRFPDAVSE
jgi:cytidylate kinase